jgi:predicted AAA+ superfamily ATPase
MWINREISSIIETNHDPIQVIRGPRQCGKSSLIQHIGDDFVEISLDDPSLRTLAQSDPQALLDQFDGKKIFIDEAQYAPEIFPVLKRKIDLYKRKSTNKSQTIIRMTGSNQILMDRNVKESLAGRASFFDMNTLSVSEICAAKTIPIQEIIFNGGWPELYATSGKNVKKYLDDYINSYIERDIVLSAGIQKQNEFLRFAKLLAGRVGQIIDFASLGKDVGVDAKTIKDWTSVLERMNVIVLTQPYFSNLSKRLIKSPKLYFIDTGLACRLQGWSTVEPIFSSPQQGGLFENLVFSELFKTNLNFQLGLEIFHWRSRDGEEIDFLIQIRPGKFVFIDAKMSFQLPADISNFPEVRKVFKGKSSDLWHCCMTGDTILNRNIPITKLKDFLTKLATA